MNACGIICEYNPFHLGHAHHIAVTKRETGRPVICVMSGNFVQRGDAAVYPKHTRAECAVVSGADLVLQMNITSSLSSAEGFASGGVALLASLGVCDRISFGSECGDIGKIMRTADVLSDEAFFASVPEYMNSGVSYPLARSLAMEHFAPECADVLRSPNDNLGVEYIRAIKKLGAEIEPICVKREGGGHESELSSSFIRGRISSGSFPSELMPPETAEILKRETPVLVSDDAIVSRLRALPRESYSLLPDASEGLGDRLFKYAVTEPCLAEICDKVKTKRYTHSRIRRMAMCAAIGISRSDITPFPFYIRVLAANETGRKLLRGIREKADIPIITKPADGLKLTGTAQRLFALDCAATDLYSLFYSDAEHRRGGAELRKSPVML